MLIVNAIKNKSKGYSIFELVAVVAVLGILSSLTIPSVMRIFDFNNIDEAKAILNSAAADCLQKTRLENAEDKNQINDEIISNNRIKTIGYKINAKSKTCSDFEIKPISKKDTLRYPMGFSIYEGRVSKFASPPSDDKAILNSCRSWAGVNCELSKSLKKLIKHKKAIDTAEKECSSKYLKWLRQGTNPYKFQKWNRKAKSGCPSRPPKDGSTSYETKNTCTINGCNKIVYGLDGQQVGFSKEEYDLAVEEKYGKICKEKTKNYQKNNFTNPDQNTAVTIFECGSKEFWFLDGTNYKTKRALSEALDLKASDQCVADREKARKEGFEGLWGPTEGPDECAKEQYICEKTFVSEKNFFMTCGLEPPIQCKRTLLEIDNKCLNYELKPFLQQKCGERPIANDGSSCRRPGKGKPQAGWDKTNECKEWAVCMDLS
jgi:type II secretory pathway pseudopilin PulG